LITAFPIVVPEHNVIGCRIFNNGSIQLRVRKANAYWKKIRTLFGAPHSPRRAQMAFLERSLLRSLSPASDELFLTEFETMRALTSVVATCYLLEVSTRRMDKCDVV
jgi:hypothetical protein